MTAAKVLYVSPVGERGGAETVLLNILRFQDRSSFEPIVCFLKTGPLVAEVSALGVRTVVEETGRLREVSRTVSTIRRIHQLVSRSAVDLVFGNMSMGHVYGGLAALGTSAQTVWFQHGIPESGDPLNWLAAAVPAARIYVNSLASEAAQRRLPWCAARTQLLYYGVDCARFSPSHNACRPLLRALGIPANRPVVAMVARFQRWKGQDVFIRAAAHVAAERPDVHFLLVGDTLFGLEPEFKTHLQKLVEELGLSSRITFAGFRDDVPALLNEVDVVVHPPVKPEPFGLAVVEALLMSKAVVASDEGGPAEIITDTETGLLVPPGDPAALARHVLSLLDDPVKRQTLGQNGRAAMLQRFTMERMIAELEASYRQVLSGRTH